MFVSQHTQEWPVQVVCQVLQLSRSAYYSWLSATLKGINQKQNQVQTLIVETFQQHRRRYGVRRLVVELKAKGINIGSYQVRKVLQKNGLKAIQPRSFVPRTTDSRHPYPISPNLLQEQPLPIAPNQVWVGDITYIALTNGAFLYLAVWMDLYSRRIIGWQLDDNMKEELVTAAFKKAYQSRSAKQGLIVHSDRGGQYAGNAFRKLIAGKKVIQSMNRADNPYDNAYMESCFSRFKAELMQDGAFSSKEDAQTEIFEYIEMYYNPIRRHSSLNYMSPVNFEQVYYNN
ncbi:MAG TPA: IS3 family transposase [Phormidium sp.]